MFDIESFMPHGHCFLWQPGVLWTHVISDGLIALAYFSIPLFMLSFVRQKKEILKNLKYVLLMFVLFILFCGITHAIAIWTMWSPQYYWQGILKAITAVLSIGTAISVWRLLPAMLKIPAPGELEKVNNLLKKGNENLEKSNKELKDFCHVVGHDLRSPLRRISLVAGLLHEECQGLLPVEQRDSMLDITNRIEKMDDMLDGLLKYSKTGSVNTNLEETNIVTLVRDIEQLIDFPTTFKLQVTTKISNIHCKKTPLQLIIRNLIDNAVKHHDKEAGVIEVICEAVPESSYVMIKVKDNGKGIPEDYHDHIFGLFKNMKGGGTGIGLAMCKKLVEGEGGTISVANNQNQPGVTFTFTWPIEKDPSS